MAATYVVIAAFITVTGLVSAQLPFGALPDYGVGDIGFGHLGGAGAFTHGFGPFPGESFPFYGMTHPMPWPASVGGPLGTTHTVTHSPGVGLHHAAAHVGASKTVTVGHHHPATHVTTIHHPAVTTHMQHVNAGFPGTAPFSPFGYGPGPVIGESFPYYGMSHPMPWPASLGGAGGTTHTVTHTSGPGVPHHAAAHVGASKTVTVGHHHPATHVTTVHHPASSVATHTQHVNYGATFPGTAPFLPFGYGPGPLPGESSFYYGMNHPMSWPAPFGGAGGTTHTVTHTSGAPHHAGSHVTTSKTVTVGHHHPATHVTTVHHPTPMVSSHIQHVNYGVGFPGAAPYSPFGYGHGFQTPVVAHHQTVSHMNPGFGVSHVSTGFPGALSPGMYEQSTAFPGAGYSYDSLNPAFGTSGIPFPYVYTGLHDGAVGASTVHTVHHHPGVGTPSLYTSALPGYPMGNPYGSYSMYGSSTTVTKHTKTSSQKPGSSKKT